MASQFYSIGFVRRVIGLKGEVGIQLDVDRPERYRGIDAVFLQQEPENIPLFLTQADIRGTELVIRAEGVTNPDEAKKLVGKTVVLPLEVLPDLGDKRFYFHEIKGFEVFDERFGSVGIADDVYDRPMQPVLRVLRGKTEILLPLPQGAVQKVDRAKKQLHLRTPEGLIELYLEPDRSGEEE